MDREYRIGAVAVELSEATLDVTLEDGRTVSVPLWWYPRLHTATPAQRANWVLLPGGYGIHWPEIDEDVGVWALLEGGPAPGALPPTEEARAL
ncbi:MAG: DUF2442 domain-containing protein [Gemmatimonadota bacterium]